MFDDLCEMAFVDDPKLWDVERDDVIEMLRRAQEMREIGKVCADKLSAHLGERLDGDVTLPDGWVCKVERRASRTGFNKPALWAVVEQVAGRNLRTADGEMVTALDRRTVESLCDLRTSNQKAWQQVAGVNLDEFCDVKWTSAAKVVKP